jgi:hypothetical protein
MANLQQRISSSTSSWYSNYGERPAKLFSGAEVLLTIVIALAGNTKRTRHVTGLRKWNAEQREHLFATTSYVGNVESVRGFVMPKFSSEIESLGFSKIWFDKKRLGVSISRSGGSELFYRIGGGRYWKIFTTEAPKFSVNGILGKSSRESALTFTTDSERLLACALLSSSVFFWVFSITTNGRDLNPIDLQDYPVDLDRLGVACPKLPAMASDLMADYQIHSQLKVKQSTQTGRVEYQEFYPRISKCLIDDIDVELGRFYKLSNEELDYIINYDIKYRMGQGMDDNDD